MFKYEGLGCIYWHMVSKLLLAVGENIGQAKQSDERLRLLEHYDSIKSGLGAHKSPGDYGAFPFDPYSHTPAFAGVQQPGMTGQVKEDLISRFAELGVVVRSGRAHFRPRYLKRAEFFETARTWTVPGSETRTVDLPAGSLAFTLCGIPVVYRLGTTGGLRLHRRNDEPLSFDTPALDQEWSGRLFSRDPAIIRIEVEVDPGELR